MRRNDRTASEQGGRGWRRVLRLLLLLVWLGVLAAAWPYLLAALAEAGLAAAGWPGMRVAVTETGLSRTALVLRPEGWRGTPVSVAVDHPWSDLLREGRVHLAATVPDLAAVPFPAAWGVRATTGRLTVRGVLVWADGKLDGNAVADVRGAGGQLAMGDAGAMDIAGLSGRVPLSGFDPPVIPDDTKLTAERVDAGTVLTGVEVLFGLRRTGKIAVTRVEAAWSGGRLLTRPFVVSPDGPAAALTLEVVGVDVASVLALAEVEGLEGTGAVSGRVPMVLHGESLRIESGKLAADGPGVVRYDPARAPHGALQAEGDTPVATVMKALSDFRYTTLEMLLDGTVGEEMAARLVIHGSNPSFYDGYPVALTLNLSGALDQVVRRGLNAYRLPERLGKQVAPRSLPGAR